MSRFILFKRDDVDPYYRRIMTQKDVPKEFQDRVRVNSTNIVIDKKRIIHIGHILNFHDNSITYGNPFGDDYYFTPLGYVPLTKTIQINCINGKLVKFINKGHIVCREPISIDDPMLDDTLFYSHRNENVIDFRTYYKANLQS